MRTIKRDNYTPKIGDYHEMIVRDDAQGVIWLFDCDGVYMNITCSPTPIADGPGDNTDYAASQRFVTEIKTNGEQAVADATAASISRDENLGAGIVAAKAELMTAITDVDNGAKGREQALKTDYTQKYNSLDNDIETLTDVTNQLVSITRQFIDITDSGMPAYPDPDVFYYTVEED